MHPGWKLAGAEFRCDFFENFAAGSMTQPRVVCLSVGLLFLHSGTGPHLNP